MDLPLTEPDPGGAGEPGDGAGSHSRLVAHLPWEPGSTRTARHLTRELLAQLELSRAVLEDVELVVHELVMNAVTHGRPAAADTVELACLVWPHTPRWLRVDVLDGGADGTVQPMPFSDERASGRGLLMVAGLSQSWSVDRTVGTRVTATLSLGTDPAPPPGTSA